MFKKLCILLIFSKLKVTKLLIDKYRMHNLYAIFAKLLNICKQIAGNLVNESGNVPRRGVVPKFSDLEVVALNMASEAVGIDSESLLFAKLQEYRIEIFNLISRRRYNNGIKTKKCCYCYKWIHILSVICTLSFSIFIHHPVRFKFFLNFFNRRKAAPEVFGQGLP